jgi:hypothetical protein
MAYSLPEAVKAAHSLSPEGQKMLRQRIAETYGATKLPPPPVMTAAEKAAADARKQAAAERAAAKAKARAEAETKTINDIMAALAGGPDGTLGEDHRQGVMRAIAEVIGADSAKPEKAQSKPIRPTPVIGDKVTVNGDKGTITKVEGDTATEITMANGAVLSDVVYLYSDSAKAAADLAYQAAKEGE